MGVTRVKGLEKERKKEEEEIKKVRRKKEKKLKEGIRGIVRVAGTDLEGEKPIYIALQKIKGVGGTFANAICRVLGLERRREIGSLSDEEIQKIEKVIEDPSSFGIPDWVLNRRRDPETGENKHLVGTELTLTQQQDIRKMIEIRCYKGIRHMYGLPVRGQRTRSSFRKGRTVGVVRKKAQPGAKK